MQGASDPRIESIKRKYLEGGGEESNFALALEEAQFGWAEIRAHLPTEGRCLEVGAGPGLLSCIAALSSPALAVVALEPVAEGFSHYEGILQQVDAAKPGNLSIRRLRFEEAPTNERFDFVWSVNVFEHLDDWRAAVAKVCDMLAPGGSAIILCPNYDIGYEPHFRLPIVWSKNVTASLFRRTIEAHEDKNRTHGLWNSINLIGVRDLNALRRRLPLPLEVDGSITARMLQRIDEDSSFEQRQGWFAPFVRAARRTGIMKLVAKLPAQIQPYIAIRIGPA
ncbi:MAG: class I SAM-dependent methyltransferase [Hyphomonadaceae bacterium]